MEILTVFAIIGGVSLCLFGHHLARNSAGSDREQSQTPASELQHSGETHLEQYR